MALSHSPNGAVTLPKWHCHTPQMALSHSPNGTVTLPKWHCHAPQMALSHSENGAVVKNFNHILYKPGVELEAKRSN